MIGPRKVPLAVLLAELQRQACPHPGLLWALAHSHPGQHRGTWECCAAVIVWVGSEHHEALLHRLEPARHCRVQLPHHEQLHGLVHVFSGHHEAHWGAVLLLLLLLLLLHHEEHPLGLEKVSAVACKNPDG